MLVEGKALIFQIVKGGRGGRGAEGKERELRHQFGDGCRNIAVADSANKVAEIITEGRRVDNYCCYLWPFFRLFFFASFFF